MHMNHPDSRYVVLIDCTEYVNAQGAYITLHMSCIGNPRLRRVLKSVAYLRGHTISP